MARSTDSDPGVPQLPPSGLLTVMRRMRVPLIVLIVIFAVSVLGLSLIPGEDARGDPRRMTIFEAFYFISSTATTIGFGEVPHPLTASQRMWVSFTIYLSVVGWAYAIGSLLSVMQDRAFRRALVRRHVVRGIRSLVDPFLVVVGYGRAGAMLTRSLDEMGRRCVVVDRDEDRVSAVELDAHRADVPALLGNARDTDILLLAGITHPQCEGVLTVAGDDETNLDVTMTVSLVRPGLPVIARALSRAMGERMHAFGAWEVVNPLDRFGDHLRIVLRSPSAYRLMLWLTSGPGTPLPPLLEPLPRGHWVVCGYGELVHELSADLSAEGLDIQVVEAGRSPRDNRSEGDAEAITGARLEDAAAFVAATRDDVTNLWLLETARRANPDLYLAAMQNRTADAGLYQAAGVHFGMTPAEVLVHEVLARLANPALMQFLPKVPRLGEEWAKEMTDKLVSRCGHEAPDLWLVRLTPEEAPTLVDRLEAGAVTLGALLRSPEDRDHQIDAVILALHRGEDDVAAPDDEQPLHLGDELLVAASPAARRAMDATLAHEPTAAYILEGEFVPSGWLWRKLAARRAGVGPG